MSAQTDQWEVPPRLWGLLAFLVIAVMVIFSGLTVKQWMDQRADHRQFQDLRRDLCTLTTDLAGGPTPPAGPTGDRARALLPKLKAVRDSSCK